MELRACSCANRYGTLARHARSSVDNDEIEEALALLATWKELYCWAETVNMRLEDKKEHFMAMTKEEVNTFSASVVSIADEFELKGPGHPGECYHAAVYLPTIGGFHEINHYTFDPTNPTSGVPLFC